MDSFRIFIVEDDPWYGEMLKYHLSLNPDYEIHLFDNATDCLKNLHLKPAIVCIDYNLPDISGGVLFKRIKSINTSIPIIIISGQEEIRIALDLLKDGAYAYINKDDNTKDHDNCSNPRDSKSISNSWFSNYFIK